MSELEIIVSRTSLTGLGGGRPIDVPCSGMDRVAGAVEDLWSEIATRGVERVRFGSDQFGLVALDATVRPVHEVMWADDERSADDAAWCNKKFPADWWIERIGETPLTRHGITKLSWLHRSDADAWSRMARLCGVDDYVRWLCLGDREQGLVISSSTMESMGWGRGSDANSEVLALIDKDREWSGVVPRSVPSGTVLGRRNGVEIVT